MKKETKQIMFLGLLVVFGLAYIYYTYLFLPEWGAIKTKNQELMTQETYYKQLVQYQQDMQNLETEIKNLEQESTQLSAQIPTSIDKPQLTYYLYSLAKEIGVEPLSLGFDQVTQSSNFQSISMNFSCQGKVVDILNLIKKMQSSNDQKLSVQSVNLTNQQGSMKADLRLIAYARLENTNQPGNKQTNIPPVSGLGSIGEMFKH